MRKSVFTGLILLLLIMTGVTACQSSADEPSIDDDAPVDNEPVDDDPADGEPGNDQQDQQELPVIEEGMDYGKAYVDQVEMVVMESFPLQVSAIVSGNLADGCTSIHDIIVDDPVENTIKVTITTKRPTDMMCTQALVPFEERISLPVEGLPAGTYIVDVNGVTASFTFEQDNSLDGGS